MSDEIKFTLINIGVSHPTYLSVCLKCGVAVDNRKLHILYHENEEARYHDFMKMFKTLTQTLTKMILRR